MEWVSKRGHQCGASSGGGDDSGEGKTCHDGEPSGVLWGEQFDAVAEDPSLDAEEPQRRASLGSAKESSPCAGWSTSTSGHGRRGGGPSASGDLGCLHVRA
jgi:hypothetical protein